MRVSRNASLASGQGRQTDDLGSTCGISPCGEGPPGAETYAQYTEVIALFTQSLNGYAANSLSRFERARFDKLFNAEGISIASSAIFSAPSICPQGWHCKRRANRKTFLPCGPDLRDDDWSPGVASLGEYACMQRYLWPKCLGNAQ